MTDHNDPMNREWAVDSFTSSIRQLHDTDPVLKEPGEHVLSNIYQIIHYSEQTQAPVDVSASLNQLRSLESSIQFPTFQAARGFTYDALLRALDCSVNYTKGQFRTDRDIVSRAMTILNHSLLQERQNLLTYLAGSSVNPRMLVGTDEAVSGRLATFTAIQTSLWQFMKDSPDEHSELIKALQGLKAKSKESCVSWPLVHQNLDELQKVASSGYPKNTTVGRQIQTAQEIFAKIFDVARPYTAFDMMDDISKICNMEQHSSTGAPEDAVQTSTDPEVDPNAEWNFGLPPEGDWLSGLHGTPDFSAERSTANRTPEWMSVLVLDKQR